MSSHVQVIEQDGKPAFYVVPADLWERMREAAEDAEDIADLPDALGHIAKAPRLRRRPA